MSTCCHVNKVLVMSVSIDRSLLDTKRLKAQQVLKGILRTTAVINIENSIFVIGYFVTVTSQRGGS